MKRKSIRNKEPFMIQHISFRQNTFQLSALSSNYSKWEIRFFSDSIGRENCRVVNRLKLEDARHCLYTRNEPYIYMEKVLPIYKVDSPNNKKHHKSINTIKKRNQLSTDTKRPLLAGTSFILPSRCSALITSKSHPVKMEGTMERRCPCRPSNKVLIHIDANTMGLVLMGKRLHWICSSTGTTTEGLKAINPEYLSPAPTANLLFSSPYHAECQTS